MLFLLPVLETSNQRVLPVLARIRSLQPTSAAYAHVCELMRWKTATHQLTRPVPHRHRFARAHCVGSRHELHAPFTDATGRPGHGALHELQQRRRKCTRAIQSLVRAE
ncbi:hypothetical protein GY45DRAFT_607709 [Cubamyces sp. BRFM 1775]|nr:hypothetical protein GY45DRAFT_607709 [Cubamyces sp. BRFM 1775]